MNFLTSEFLYSLSKAFCPPRGFLLPHGWPPCGWTHMAGLSFLSNPVSSSGKLWRHTAYLPSGVSFKLWQIVFRSPLSSSLNSLFNEMENPEKNSDFPSPSLILCNFCCNFCCLSFQDPPQHIHGLCCLVLCNEKVTCIHRTNTNRKHRTGKWGF